MSVLIDPNNSSAQVSSTSPEVTIDFLEVLVQAILGRSIAEIPEESRLEMIQKCVEVFSDYILKYATAKWGKKDALRLQASQKFMTTDVFDKFADLGEKFDEAYQSFFDTVGQSWEEEVAIAA